MSFHLTVFELFKKGPQINFWRAPNDNDKGSNMIGRLGVWREASDQMSVKDISMGQTGTDRAFITVEYGVNPVQSSQKVTYVIWVDGRIDVESTLEVGKEELTDLPRFGMRWELPVNMDRLTYFGRGPHENYVDRSHGSFVGIYSGKVADQYVKYVRPQENGYKTDVRWFELRNENEVGIRVTTGSEHLGFSALHNPIEKLYVPY